MKIQIFLIKCWTLAVLFLSFTVAEVCAQTYVRIGTLPYTADFFGAVNFANGIRFSTEGAPGGVVTVPGISSPLTMVAKFAYMIPTELYDELMRAPRNNRQAILQANLPQIVNFNRNFASQSGNPFGCLFLNATRCEVIPGTQFSTNLNSSNYASWQQLIIINYMRDALRNYVDSMSNDIQNILNQILISVNRKSDANMNQNNGSGVGSNNYKGGSGHFIPERPTDLPGYGLGGGSGGGLGGWSWGGGSGGFSVVYP